ncbi:class I SAM-dependent methyltransferase [Rhodoligotrophos ferricapiens]|uniref:class I SAM-dependent methyltransferase n=1 Tax=Rhodoligotrophos ferricapiens TaxID=3069264 RepID=UPI00315DE137
MASRGAVKELGGGTNSGVLTLGGSAEHYVRHGQKSVDGWLSVLDGLIISFVSAQQQRNGISGSLGEIGIHHGRLFILLALLARDDERCFAVDIFEDQHLNLDRSGEGSEERFRRNLSRFDVPQDRVMVFRASSLAIGWPELMRDVDLPARMFSIDGGHTAEITVNDLRIADEGLHPHGVVILDDYFNAEFPEVSQGLCTHILSGGKLAPFAIGDNKVLLARPGQGQTYRRALIENLPRRNFVKTTSMFGEEVTVFRTPHRMIERVRQSELTRSLTEHPLGKALKPVVRRILG